MKHLIPATGGYSSGVFPDSFGDFASSVTIRGNAETGCEIAQAQVVARGVQITGILVCMAAGRELDQCQCFADLALTETKERVKRILKAADDWVRLADSG